MNDFFAVKKNSTGEIVRYGNVPSADVSVQAAAGETAYVVNGDVRSDTYYFVGTTATAKVSLDTVCTLTNTGGWLANGSDTITYGTALPNPALVTISCSNLRFTPINDVLITDGTLILTTTSPGNYVITFDAFPYLKKFIYVTAT